MKIQCKFYEQENMDGYFQLEIIKTEEINPHGIGKLLALPINLFFCIAMIIKFTILT